MSSGAASQPRSVGSDLGTVQTVHVGSGVQLPSNELGVQRSAHRPGRRTPGRASQWEVVETWADETSVSTHRGSQEDGEVSRMCGSVSHSPSVQGRIGR